VRIRLGTRGSRLALAQAKIVEEALAARGVKIEVATVATTGDRKADWDRSEKGIFVAEIDQALAGGEIDIAVHSLKDIPTEMPAGLEIACVTHRESPYDAVSPPGALKTLPGGARVGTSSIRRKAEIVRARPDLSPVDLRGNVDTRLEKLERGDVEALLLAEAGLRRLGIDERKYERLPAETVVPAAGQGALAVVARADAAERLGHEWREAAWALDHSPSRLEAEAERAFIAAMGAGCHSPVGALGRAGEGARLTLYAAIGGTERRMLLEGTARTSAEAVALGRHAAAELGGGEKQ
jgi:hydroxymethylbilane synthase